MFEQGNMVVDKVTLFTLYFILFILNNSSVTFCLKNKNEPCLQFNPCKCIFPTGRGINLTPINQNLSVQGPSSAIIYIHLCEDVPFGSNINTNECFSNVSICYMDDSKNQSISLGKAEDMKIISTSQFQPITVQFDNKKNLTNIALACDEAAIDDKLVFKSFDGTAYNLELYSKHACVHQFTAAEGPPGGLSTGSVLVIMFLVFTLVYFVGGMLTLRLLRGAEGKEMIPNIDFWMDLPNLVREGIVFTLNGFQLPPSYDRI